MAEQRYCPKCRKTMAADAKFYTYRDGSKTELCKSCLTMHINNYEEDTYLWLLEQFDVPYIDVEWEKERQKQFEKNFLKAQNSGASDPKGAAYSMTRGDSVVFGKYLSKMKMKQHMNERWADTARLKEERELKAKLYGTPDDIMKDKIDSITEAYQNGEISEAQYKTYTNINGLAENEAPPSLEEQYLAEDHSNTPSPQADIYPTNENPFTVVDIPDVGADLTEEDKIYLAMKWGRLYSAADWVYLEQKYNDFMNSFDIQGAARIDTLIQICKISLKSNQALDAGDMDSHSKLVRSYDTLMKSAKFTEAQRKEEKSGDFDAVGQVVYFAEKVKGKIDRHKVDELHPLDVVDKAMFDLKNYNKELILNDPALSQMFENFIKRRENAAAAKEDLVEAEKEGLDHVEITDKDYEEFNELLNGEEDE